MMRSQPDSRLPVDRPERERSVERYLLQRCRGAGALCLKFTSPARSGVPDRVVVAPGSVVFVELKRPGARPRPDQVAMHDKIRRFGGSVEVIDSREGVDAFVEQLQQHRAAAGSGDD